MQRSGPEVVTVLSVRSELRSKKQPHIYFRKKVARTFEEVRSFPPEEALTEWVRGILSGFTEGLDRGVRLLEGGVGTGVMFRVLLPLLLSAQEEALCVGVDHSPPMIEQLLGRDWWLTAAKRWRGHVAVGFADLEMPLPFAEGFFDVIWLSGVVHCLRDGARTLGRLVNLLRPGGCLVVVLETDALTRVMSGEPQNRALAGSLPPAVVSWWQRYWQERERRGIACDERVPLVYDPERVIERMRESGSPVSAPQRYVLEWKASVDPSSWEKLVAQGLIFALGQGIGARSRAELARFMRQTRDQEASLEPFTTVRRLEGIVWRKS